MVTVERCLEKAKEKMALAQSDPKHRRKYEKAAREWMRLARKLLLRHDAKVLPIERTAISGTIH